MNKKICPREEEVQVCLDTGKLSPEIKNHIMGCPVCQDVVLVKGWMSRFKERAWEADMRKKTLPDAGSVWNRVYTGKRIDKKLVLKAMRPLIVPQVLSIGVFIAGIGYMMIWSFNKFGYIHDNPIVSQILPFFGILTVSVFFFFAFCALIAAFDRRRYPT